MVNNRAGTSFKIQSRGVTVNEHPGYICKQQKCHRLLFSSAYLKFFISDLCQNMCTDHEEVKFFTISNDRKKSLLQLLLAII